MLLKRSGHQVELSSCGYFGRNKIAHTQVVFGTIQNNFVIHLGWIKFRTTIKIATFFPVNQNLKNFTDFFWLKSGKRKKLIEAMAARIVKMFIANSIWK